MVLVQASGLTGEGIIVADTFSFNLGFGDVDSSLLPADARTPGTDSFRQAVTQMLEEQFRHFRGRVQIAVHDERRLIEVRWSADPKGPSPGDIVLDLLKRGDYKTAVPLLQLLIRMEPGDALHFYNLGMALSDMGQLPKAQEILRESIRLDPQNINAIVALGVAQARGGDLSAAIATLKLAVKEAPDNPWAQRNLGGCLLQAGELEEGEVHLRTSVELAPDDQQALVGLGQALEKLDRLEEADELYIRVIKLGASTRPGEAAKEARSRVAQTLFRRASHGTERMDAVMYCLGALEKFEKMTPTQVRDVAFEIALLGMRGLDVNDPTQKYQLKSLQGQFSGLHLVSLMYVGFKQIAPEQNTGFDLSREYAAAQSLRRHRP